MSMQIFSSSQFPVILLKKDDTNHNTLVHTYICSGQYVMRTVQLLVQTKPC